MKYNRGPYCWHTDRSPNCLSMCSGCYQYYLNHKNTEYSSDRMSMLLEVKAQHDKDTEDKIQAINARHNKLAKLTRHDVLPVNRNRQLKHRYKITLEDYNNIYIKQKGKCAICHRFKDSGELYVDHNHETGNIRELLCPRCNTFVGFMEKNYNIFPNMMNYIQKHSMKGENETNK